MILIKTHTLSLDPKKEFFWGTVMNFQSYLLVFANITASGICISLSSLAEFPASTISMDDWGSSESLLARTHPAVPAPTTKFKEKSKQLIKCSITIFLLATKNYMLYKICMDIKIYNKQIHFSCHLLLQLRTVLLHVIL